MAMFLYVVESDGGVSAGRGGSAGSLSSEDHCGGKHFEHRAG